LKNLLYIGNKLSQYGLNKTTIETLGPLFEHEGYRVTYASSQKNLLLRMFDMLFKTIANCKKSDYVIIDTYSTSSFWYAFFTSQLCRILQLQYIPILHGGNLPQRLKQNPVFCQMLFRNAYKNIAPSPYLLEAFKKEGYSNLDFIPNVIQMEDYPFKKRSIIQPKLLWVRAFASIYNPKMAIAVLLKLQKKYPEASLCMVGPDKDGSLAEVQKYVTEKQIANVAFTGKLTKKEWISLSEEFDVFINTTHFDNTPVSVMEAMALGLPIVSTNVGGIPLLLIHNTEALLVDDADADGMAEAIERLLENPILTEALICNAKNKVITFDWKDVKEQWNNLLISN
jgi:L-malate glycosyltransferase